MSFRFALVVATPIAMALTSFDLCPSAWAQAASRAHQKAGTLGPVRARSAKLPVPFEAFGALAGAITTITAAEHQRETYGPYYSPSYTPHGVARSRQTPPLVTRPVAGTP